MRMVELTIWSREDYGNLLVLVRFVSFNAEVAIARSRQVGWFLHIAHHWGFGWCRNFYLWLQT